MFNIAICEDDRIFIKRLKELIEAYFKSNDYEATIDMFFDGEDLIKEVEEEKTRYDLIFLDIDMPKMNGIEAGKTLREKDKDFILVFLTSLDEEVYKVFELDTFRFVRKSHFDKEIKPVLDAAYKRLLENARGYDFKITEGMIKLSLPDILYFNIVNRKVNVNTLTDSYAITNMSFKEIEEMFSMKGFISIYKGMIVSIRAIRRIDKDTIELDNGDRLPVSRYKMPEVKKAFLTRGD